MDTLILILIFFAGWTLRGLYNAYKSYKVLVALDTLVEQKLSEEKESVVHIIIEKHNNSYLVYHKENYRFITQADTREELEKNLKDLFPGKRFGATEQNLKELGF